MPNPLMGLHQRISWYALRAGIAWRHWTSRCFKRSVVGDCPVVVSLTTHGARIATVHIAIESIIAGTCRPFRLILWLNRDTASEALPRELQRLQSRGLEICYVEDCGPHTKYYPYVCEFADTKEPLVIADDDTIYRNDWLEVLMAAHRAAPATIHCHVSRKINIAESRLEPYSDWNHVDVNWPSLRHLALGYGGVIFPPAFLALLRDAGTAFRTTCPKNDDIWLHLHALRNGYPTRQIAAMPQFPDAVPATQEYALFNTNQLASGNDKQIAATYGAHDIDALTHAHDNCAPHFSSTGLRSDKCNATRN